VPRVSAPLDFAYSCSTRFGRIVSGRLRAGAPAFMALYFVAKYFEAPYEDWKADD